MLRRLSMITIACVVVAAGTASAQPSGWRYGGRVSWVKASASSEELGDTGGALTLHSGVGFEFDATVTFSDRFGVELSAGFSTHRACVSGGDWGDIDAGRVWLAPLAAIAQYHIPMYGEWDPYVGIGISWVSTFARESADVSGAGVERIDVEGDAGVAAQLGVNYQLDHRWYANFDLRYLGTSLDARVRTEEEDFPTVTLDIKPLSVSLGLGYKF